MAEGIGEECGIFGVYFKDRADRALLPVYLYHMGWKLQHRGQLSAGIAVYDSSRRGGRIKILKEIGTIDDLFRAKEEARLKQILDYFSGTAGIGHVRYSTSGKSKNYLEQIEEAQPFFRRHGRAWKRFAEAFNGHLANYEQLRREMIAEDYILDTSVDTEIILHLVSLSLNRLSSRDKNGREIMPAYSDVFKNLAGKLDGAYNLLFLFGNGDLIALRDPLGIKPLVYGENEKLFAVASESIALEKVGLDEFRDVEPGSFVLFNGQTTEIARISDSKRRAHCHFERVYFSRADSVVDGSSINSTRERLGVNLARTEPLRRKIFRKRDDYVVVPVPKTAIPAAESYARELGISSRSAITDNDSSRGFINKMRIRGIIMDRKYGLIAERIEGKKVILFDDSIVRGETGRRIVAQLRKKGAKEIHLRSTEPAIRHPCFYGIDFPTYGELVANRVNQRNIERGVAREMGADSVCFQTLEGLIDATGFKKDELCLACLNGEYPTPAGARLAVKKMADSKKYRAKS